MLKKKAKHVVVVAPKKQVDKVFKEIEIGMRGLESYERQFQRTLRSMKRFLDDFARLVVAARPISRK